MSYDFGSFEKDAITRPKNIAWGNFAKFEKVGDKVQGYIRDVFYTPEKGMFKPARGITLETPEGEMVNVQIKRWPSNLDATDKLRLGDPLTVVFKESKKSNYPQPMKIFQFFGKELEENKANRTVAELEKADMEAQAIAPDEGDQELEKMASDAAKTS